MGSLSVLQVVPLGHSPFGQVELCANLWHCWAEGDRLFFRRLTDEDSLGAEVPNITSWWLPDRIVVLENIKLYNPILSKLVKRFGW